jgi:hypothetical protein
MWRFTTVDISLINLETIRANYMLVDGFVSRKLYLVPPWYARNGTNLKFMKPKFIIYIIS